MDERIQKPQYSIRKVAFALFAMLLVASCVADAIRYLPGTITVSSAAEERKLPIYCVQTEKPQIALTFDAAWGNEDTQNILDVLAKHKIKVTFFMTGGWVDSYPEDVKKIYEAGHDLGNHSENHKNMSQLSDSECREELISVHNKVKKLTGYEMFLFRPPFGDYDNHVVKNAEDCGYYSVQWDVDSLDWTDYFVDTIIQTVTEHAHLGNGSIILMHNGAKYTADALDMVITKLKEQGYEFVPLSQLVIRENYHMDHEGRQIADSDNRSTDQP